MYSILKKCYSMGMARKSQKIKRMCNLTGGPPKVDAWEEKRRKAPKVLCVNLEDIDKQKAGSLPRGRPTAAERPQDYRVLANVELAELAKELTQAEQLTPEAPGAMMVANNPDYDNKAPVPITPALVPEVLDSELDLARKAMEWVASGKALSEFCAQPGAVGMHTMLRLLRTDPVLREEWKLAQSIGADALFHDIIRVADYAVDPNKARVMIDARKYVAGRLRPEIYSEKTKADVEVGITINIKRFGE